MNLNMFFKPKSVDLFSIDNANNNSQNDINLLSIYNTNNNSQNPLILSSPAFNKFDFFSTQI